MSRTGRILMSAATEQRVARWTAQRWIVDAVVNLIGVEWDQPRIAYTAAAGGTDAFVDFRLAAARIKKIADIDREFARAAERREARAKQYEEEGRTVAARESYLIASLLWSLARWPILELNDWLEELEVNMNRCYAKFIDYAPHPVERVEIPFGNKSLPAYLHLPHKPGPGEKFPCVINIPGMDSSKENGVSIYGDKALKRGMAVLSVDGPGQGECFARRVLVDETAHMEAAEAELGWLADRAEIDMDNIVIRGTSFGSFFGIQSAARLGDRVKGVAVSAVCHEPGCNTLFNMACPSFKMRFMFMAGYDDEAEFDRFTPNLDLRPIAGDVKCPVLVTAGEDDQLSPLEFTRDLMSRIKTPKQLVVYQAGEHSFGGSRAALNGENPITLATDWMRARIDGKPCASEETLIDVMGNAHSTPY